MEILLILIVLAFVGYSNWLRDKSEDNRLKTIIGVIKEKEIEQPDINTQEAEKKDEIMELDEVDPEQLIEQLHDNHKN